MENHNIAPFCLVWRALQCPSHPRLVWDITFKNVGFRFMFFLDTTCTPPVVVGAPAGLSEPQRGQLKTSQWIDGVDPIIQTLWFWWGVVNCIWQNGKRLAEIDVICKVTILLAGYLTEAMPLAVWGERLKCLVRRRRRIAPCAAMAFVCKSNCDGGIWHT